MSYLVHVKGHGDLCALSSIQTFVTATVLLHQRHDNFTLVVVWTSKHGPLRCL